MTPGMWHGLARIGAEMPDDVRVVVVKGLGPSFCAGIDLRMFTAEGVPGEERNPSPADPGFDASIASFQAGYTWLRNPSIVSIAAVQGHAIGAGFQLALSCDLRIITEDAKFCMKEPALGLVPDLTGTKPLVDIVGLPRADRAVPDRTDCRRTRGRRAPPGRTGRTGSDLDGAVSDLVAALLSTDAAAARATKALLAQAAGNTLEQQAAAERAAQARLLAAKVSRA